MKHAILLQVLARLRRDDALTVVDTHAGAGLYDLSGAAASTSGEAALGVARLMADPGPPSAFAPLTAAIRAANVGEALRVYPGSPWLILQSLKPGDAYVGCELRPDDHALLTRDIGRLALARGVRATMPRLDGYLEAAVRLNRHDGRLLLLIDPPFERGDEYAAVLETLARIKLKHDKGAPAPSALIWAPLKDLETFDAFLRGVGALGFANVVIAEVRLRPLSDPMRMNGCALARVGAPDVVAAAQAICGWIASRLGEAGSSGRVWDLQNA
jgi:23S rRNA (adenine2030-N6)-methyltransferase